MAGRPVFASIFVSVRWCVHYTEGDEDNSVDHNAYTIGSDLYVDGNDNGNYSNRGSFINLTTYNGGGLTYTKLPN
jgi:hypothetical protein